MRRRISERCALAALIGLVVYCLACFYPAAWSPDSKQVVFPVFGENGIERLVITDLTGKAVREVARATQKTAALSPAAWSPDGKWIAYIRFTLAAGDRDGPVMTGYSLMLQDAESGKDRSLLTIKTPGGEEANSSDALFGPWWSRDSKTLAVQDRAKGRHDILLVGLDGKVRRKISLPKKELPVRTLSLSADARFVAYVKPRKKDKDRQDTAVYLYDVGKNTTKQVGAAAPGEKHMSPRQVWSADSRFLYVGAADEDKKGGAVEQIEIQTGKKKTVWRKRESLVYGISVSAGGDRLAVDYAVEGDDCTAIDVVDLRTGKATPVHFGQGEPPHFSTAVSPDGNWVAFCPGVKEDKKERYMGAIVSVDGSQLRFFVPDRELEPVVPKIVEARLGAALKRSGINEQLEKAGVPVDGAVAPHIEKIKAVLDKAAAREQAAIFREAIASARVGLHLTLMEETPAAKRPDRAPAVRKEIDAFLRAYPGHVLGAGFKKRLDGLLAPGEKPRDE